MDDEASGVRLREHLQALSCIILPEQLFVVGTLHRFENTTSGFDIPLQACVVKVALSIASISSYCPGAAWMLSPGKTNRTAMPLLDVLATACGLGECAAAGVGPADLPRRRFRGDPF